MLCAAATTSAETINFAVDGVCYQINTTNAPIATIVPGSYLGIDYASTLSGDLVIPSEVTYNGVTYSVNSVNQNAFAHCENITSISLPNSLKIIWYGAFQYCTSLTSLTIPASVTNIYGDGTNSLNSPIYRCDNLTTLVVESGNTKYDSRDNCNAIVETATNKLIHGCKGTTIPASVTTIGKNAFRSCTITDIVVSEGVTTIEQSAFNFCTSLKTVALPATLTTIGDNAFNGCSALESIVVAEANTTFDSRDNCNAIIKTSGDELVLGCKTTIIPASVAAIGRNAFKYCPITDIEITEGVAAINDLAFNECGQLKTVTLPSTLTKIGYGAFQNCHSLTDIYAYPHANVATGDTVTLGSDVWAFMDEPWTAANCNLHVYPADYEYYSTADQWKEFNVIADLGETQEALYLFGSWDWTTGVAFVKGEDGLWTATKEMAVGDTFKLVDQDDVWYGGVDENSVGYFEINTNLVNNPIALVSPGADFKMAVAGTYTLTADLVNKTLKLTDNATPALKGDVNGDGDVNVVDITALIDVIMNDVTDNPRADVNEDGRIDVVDITALIDIIMNM